MGAYVRWTEVEDNLIRQVYPTQGWKGCAAVMPNRSGDVIRCRASRLGVISAKGKEIKARMEPKDEGPYPWPPLSDLDRTAMSWFGWVDRTGQLRPIVKVELEAAA